MKTSRKRKPRNSTLLRQCRQPGAETEEFCTSLYSRLQVGSLPLVACKLSFWCSGTVMDMSKHGCMPCVMPEATVLAELSVLHMHACHSASGGGSHERGFLETIANSVASTAAVASM